MLTAAALLAALQTGQPLPGRHVLVTAHADDETISCAGLLSSVRDARIVQVTTGAPGHDRAVSDRRRRERTQALHAGRWPVLVLESFIPGREAYLALESLSALVDHALATTDVVWTHPYEGGHLDHDTAAYVVQRVAPKRSVLAMEFASYHCLAHGERFGTFWPDALCPAVHVPLSAEVLQRKRAAMAAYGSQAHILRKFPRPEVEAYRQAPVYDFSRPAPAPRCRWDVKGYTPTSAEWRRVIAQEELRCAS